MNEKLKEVYNKILKENRLSNNEMGEVLDAALDEYHNHKNFKKAVDYAMSMVGSKYDHKISNYKTFRNKFEKEFKIIIDEYF